MVPPFLVTTPCTPSLFLEGPHQGFIFFILLYIVHISPIQIFVILGGTGGMWLEDHGNNGAIDLIDFECGVHRRHRQTIVRPRCVVRGHSRDRGAEAKLWGSRRSPRAPRDLGKTSTSGTGWAVGAAPVLGPGRVSTALPAAPACAWTGPAPPAAHRHPQPLTAPGWGVSSRPPTGLHRRDRQNRRAGQAVVKAGRRAWDSATGHFPGTELAGALVSAHSGSGIFLECTLAVQGGTSVCA